MKAHLHLEPRGSHGGPRGDQQGAEFKGPVSRDRKQSVPTHHLGQLLLRATPHRE